MTQVVVDGSDPAFAQPAKPVGPFYGEEEALRLREIHGWDLAPGAGGWRRVVPSPRPLEVVEIGLVREAVAEGHLVIAGGGGGIPVRRGRGRELFGVEAVVDKDLTASLMAVALGAERLVILTEVDAVYRDFGGIRAEPIPHLRPEDARGLIDLLPPGSMGPKVEAALSFAEATGMGALITDVDHLGAALVGRAGTWILP